MEELKKVRIYIHNNLVYGCSEWISDKTPKKIVDLGYLQGECDSCNYCKICPITNKCIYRYIDSVS